MSNSPPTRQNCRYNPFWQLAVLACTGQNVSVQAIQHKFLFRPGNKFSHQMLDSSGTFRVVATQQTLNTLSAE
jgi:hypothetical protein